MGAARAGMVLLAEDDDNEAFFLERAFAQLAVKHPRQRVKDGVETMEYLNGEGQYSDRKKFPMPILLLLDLKMPFKNGFEVIQRTREQPGLKRLPIVVLSSSQEEADINRAYELGANTYLVKPGNYEALVELVRAFSGFWLKIAENPEVRA